MLVHEVVSKNDISEVLDRLSLGDIAQELRSSEVELAVSRNFEDNESELYYSWYVSLLQVALAEARQIVAKRPPVRGILNAEVLKAKIDIVEYIGRFVTLRKSGSRFYGRCCLHADKQASLCVYSDNQDFYCFGCGAGGDILSFIKAIKKVEFKEALQILAQEA